MNDPKTKGLEGPSPSQNLPENKADREGLEIGRWLEAEAVHG